MAKRRTRKLRLDVLPQPDDTTCGPTCLHAVYRFFGDDISLEQVVAEVPPLPGGGTLAVMLAAHALRRGYHARIFTYNLTLFDPTWFGPEIDMSERLRAQLEQKDDGKLALATDAYLEFLDLGGTVHFEELTSRLLLGILSRRLPILTGLSATYLYGCAREYQDTYDDVRGDPGGHFVVLSGYNRRKREIMVADPLHDNPGFGSPYYSVGLDRLIGAVFLGIATYDANLLLLTPRATPSIFGE